MNGIFRQLLCASVLALCLTVPAGAGGKAERAASTGGEQDKAAEAVVAVRLHFEVLELKLTAEQIERINASPEAVDVKALASVAIKAGNSRVKHVFDASTVVGTDLKVVTGTRVPIARGSTITKAGHTATQVTYEDVGCLLNCTTRWAGPGEQGRVTVSGSVEVSDVRRDGPVMLTEEIAAPVFTDSEQRFATVVQLGSEVYFSTLWSEKLTPENTDSRVYVYRLRLDPDRAK
jgi:hypothetical protein